MDKLIYELLTRLKERTSENNVKWFGSVIEMSYWCEVNGNTINITQVKGVMCNDFIEFEITDKHNNTIIEITSVNDTQFSKTLTELFRAVNFQVRKIDVVINDIMTYLKKLPK